METKLKLYRKMMLIRAVEEKIIEHYRDDEMKTPMHMSMGSEFISVGVLHALGNRAQVFSSYRSHAPYLARTGDTDKFFAEMYGRMGGTSDGKGGSMHLADPDKGFMYSSGIVASCIPVAVGAAYANKVKRNGKVAVVFFGDGATNEGNFWESINLACLLQVPVLFICEDNGLAVHTKGEDRNGYVSLTRILRGFDCEAFKNYTGNVEYVYKQTLAAMHHLEANRPVFMQIGYCRYLEHVGVYEDWHEEYRDQDKYQKWLAKDAILTLREELIDQGKEQQVKKIEYKVTLQVDTSIVKAMQAKPAPSHTAYRGVYAPINGLRRGTP